MKRTLLIIAMISIATCQVVSKSEACTCAQLLTSGDCARNSNCSWNTTKLACEVPQSTGPVTVTKNYGKSLYCEGLAQTDCLKLNECAWIDNKCTFFTSCTPYEKTIKDDCQAISKRCITDGTICVEIDLCSTYLTSTSCYQNKAGNYCVWDETAKKCSDVTECAQLPTALTKDSECRAYLKFECTAKPAGGCVDSGTNCADQVSVEGCVTNKTRSVNCFWDTTTNKCFDKKCENASTNIKTHVDCQAFLPTCTAKDGGGCVDIKTCADGKIKEGCKIDSAKKECYWSDKDLKCKDKICASAPNTLTTNSDCQKQFLASCITNGAGCVDDTSCGSSSVQEQCAVNRYNNRECTWNGSCKDKTCENAGTDIVGHDQCSTYSKACTGKANNAGGCQKRSCDNAPTTIISNAGCEDYLPNGKCIAKKDGGCISNTTCSAILLKDACVKDQNNKDCYWDTVGGNCLDKTCATLPTRLNSHSLCNGEINTCTVSSSGTCVDLLCENVVDKDNCVKDKSGADCVYYGSCYQKQCSAASQDNTTHAQCQEYLPACTLSNTKKGCIDLPLTCSALIVKENCELKANREKCGWTGSTCVDIVCTTAPTKTDDDYTVELCEAYKPSSNCVPNGTKKGCMELAAKCESRTIKEQCDVAGTKTNGGKTCLWDGTKTCYEKTCANATKEGFAGSVVVTGGEVTHNDCIAWLKDANGNPLCVVGTANNVCAPIPATCSGLGKNSCKTNILKVANTDPAEYLNCFWNDTTGKCVDGNVCANLDKKTHTDCTNASNKKCTVSADETKCVDRLSCSQYTKEPQCKKDKNDAPCTFDAATSKCADTACLKTEEDTKDFITHAQCTAKSNQCTLTNLPCGLKKAACTDYVTELACLGGILGDKAQCQWDGAATPPACKTLTFDCTKVKGAKLTGGYCNSLDATCSANQAGTACLTAQDNCSLYTKSADCKWAKTDGDCYYSGTCKPVSTLKCSELAGTTDAECKTLKSSCIFGINGKCKPNCASLADPQTYDSCQTFDAECSVQNDGKTCYYFADKNCSQLTSNTCTKGKDGTCQLTGTTCGQKTIAADANCGDVKTGTQGAAKITAKYCKDVSGGKCTALPDQSACVVVAAKCEDYKTASSNLGSCYWATEGYCYIDTVCKKYDAGTTACTAIVLGGTTNLNFNICQEFSSTCTVDSSATTKCKDYTAPTLTCADFKGTFNFFNCFHFLKTCTVNAAGTACIDKEDVCGDYDASEKCAYAVTDGPCVWDTAASKCLQKSCDAITTTDVASPSIDTCSAKQQNCTARTGGCMKRVACTVYTKKSQCEENLSGGKCIWNTNTEPGKCYDKTCTNADSTYNSHEKCIALGNCTVKLGEDGTTLGGCINLGACSDYKVIDQCKLNSTKKDCEWSLVETPNKCVDKTCTSADPASNTDFEKCQAYIPKGNCTLGAKKNEDGTYTEGGCMALVLCTEYNTQGQCKKSKNKDADGNFLNCYWNDTTKKCGDASCSQADDSFTTHDACITYGSPMNLKCTVDKDDKGCVPIPETCEEMSKGQCVDTDSKKNKCIWLEGTGTGSCATRTCENAVSPATASDCSNHLSYCTMIDSGSKCKTKTCEDYAFTDDATCAALFKNSKCTTNGKFCVNRGTCASALSQKGCTIDTSLNPCEWIVPTDTTKPAYCVQKTCNTAPKEYNSESQCLQYFTPKIGSTCTTQQGGGCVQRSSCSAAKVQSACTTDATQNICAWDSDTSTCRNQECKDISGSSHAACQNPTDKNFKGKCTAGKSGKCAAIQKCSLTTVEAACVVGTDGPCIWLPDYPNTDNTKGACFLYDSCRSLKWSNDPLCKYISDKCTTDGQQCIGITQCGKTNVNGGCVTGTDGECITTVATLGSTNKVCTKYVNCNSALFTTHSECKTANPKCTTNGTSSCIELAACSTYVKEACNYNKDGVQKNSSGQITSTGQCKWDDTTSVCRDQNCSDLVGISHLACSSQLSTCTTDGTICITKDSCTKYTTNSACINALGTEGLCQWTEGTAGAAGTCRVKTCDDITGGTNTQTCSAISTCTTDGTKCIPKTTCDKYVTKAGCNTTGTDGICVWTETTTGTTTTGKCSLMTNCTAAAKDQNACQLASNRCKWTASTATVASSCVDHTCETFNASQGRCTYFPNWDSSKYNICRTVSGKCTAADPKTLAESECYTLSAYMYSWNSKTSACAQCGTTIVTPNNSSNGNETNNNGSTSTDSGYVLGVAVLLGYLMY
ncbi:unnamed protein product (macronuclear) [Paramecium tetraurelia]|uniref:Uncharacterized protein n=1 Tax=Paramecium tetraurelia TaxID=5888 RepID=A0DI99_PARTE|nr:uncharacterized protein GSPATT00017138001 [Paramecium tetraurelia]CAK82766.1 unnamed protein product [Paramecium tetraurelia]|eukprot:XP_001450163.1 hypothetical protein (macronuclear) [Paramecium tetraurelia strain d4-2]